MELVIKNPLKEDSPKIAVTGARKTKRQPKNIIIVDDEPIQQEHPLHNFLSKLECFQSAQLWDILHEK